MLRRPERLATWCASHGAEEALVGGFFVRPGGTPLGEVRTGGVARFSAGQAQFDSDITDGRDPRAALGLAEDRLVAVACDGRSAGDAA